MTTNQETFILDASVAAKWFFEEEMTEQSLPFKRRLELQEIRIVVPEFFYSEVANLCWKRVRKKQIPVDKAIARLGLLMDLPFEAYSDRELSDVALEHSLRFAIPVYDGLYLALAEIYAAPLITADKALFQVCRGRFDFIEYLGDVREK